MSVMSHTTEGYRETEDDLPDICRTHRSEKIISLGKSHADRMGVVADVEVFTCEDCRGLKRSSGRQFRVVFSLTGPKLDSYHNFLMARDFYSLTGLINWVVDWQRYLPNQFFDKSDPNERDLYSSNTLFFIMADVAKNMETRLQKDIEFYEN